MIDLPLYIAHYLLTFHYLIPACLWMWWAARNEQRALRIAGNRTRPLNYFLILLEYSLVAGAVQGFLNWTFDAFWTTPGNSLAAFAAAQAVSMLVTRRGMVFRRLRVRLIRNSIRPRNPAGWIRVP